MVWENQFQFNNIDCNIITQKRSEQGNWDRPTNLTNVQSLLFAGDPILYKEMKLPLKTSDVVAYINFIMVYIFIL